MADEREPSDAAPATEKPSKLPYSPPEITWQEALGDRPHLMSSCAQHAGQDEACDAAPTS
jgi:hypothetical protein